MSTATTAPDALDALLEVLRGGEAGSGVQWLDSSGQPVSAGPSSVSIRLSIGSSSNVFPRDAPTRLARDRPTILSSNPLHTPSSSPHLFLALDILVFAALEPEESNAAYLLKANKVMPGRFLNATTRPVILAYLIRAEGCPLLLSKEEAERRKVALESAGPSTTPPDSPPPSVVALYSGGLSAGAGSAGSSSTLKRTRGPYVANATDAAFVKRLRTSGLEVHLRTRSDVLRGSVGGNVVDFSSIRESISGLVKNATGAHANAQGGVGEKANGSKAPASRSAQSGINSSINPSGAQKRRRGDPIILLSSAPTALVGLSNIESLLGKSRFITQQEAKAGGMAPGIEGMISLYHPISSSAGAAASNKSAASAGGSTNPARGQRFLVVDSVEALGRLGSGAQDAWDRVVAVFTTGQLWQFKGYRTQDPKALWREVMGVYVRWSNESRNGNVKDWNVTELVVDLHKRHLDKQLSTQFWRTLDSWMARNKPELLGNPTSSSGR
ncbi:CDC73-domain-containing protein [Ceraceosorus guamensis]|uniref:CDC73-domain-containing protein n=1 Tax=Ceraceosorus guamensis TaxID=1522189 RepID=A0A316VWU3_9BASI|nr:CDC73-domain-containing protein [Ceraceosorus guamensis]PWN41774.1 CDC73-domain-containing protein [Ceraceosorus guamensis]